MSNRQVDEAYTEEKMADILLSGSNVRNWPCYDCEYVADCEEAYAQDKEGMLIDACLVDDQA